MAFKDCLENYSWFTAIYYYKYTDNTLSQRGLKHLLMKVFDSTSLELSVKAEPKFTINNNNIMLK
jgi:hypothetical protein